MRLKTILMGAVAAMAIAPIAHAERGSDGDVKIIYWQAPSILNPYLSGGTKDIEASSLVVEPLARFDQTGTLVPYLAESIPTVENGGVSADLTSITWKLKEGLLWSDGTPVTSADVKFTADYCMAPDGGCAQSAKFDGVKTIDTPDERTIIVTFSAPKPVPYAAFVGGQSPVIQAAQFKDCLGAKAQECTSANFGPIGTGPFVVTDFKPNDVITMKANENYRDPAKPAFATLTFKGGGDAAAAGRAVMETGEFDYAWNLQLAPDIIAKMAEGGKGVPVSGFGTLVERIEMNMTDPSPDLAEGERATAKHPHPILSDFKVRQALSMAIDRNLLVEIGYGQAGRPTCNLVPAPELFASDNTGCLTQDVEGAKALLEEAGWTVGAGGVREKDGKKLKLLYQTSTNGPRQKTQAIVKQACQKAGIDVELKSVVASVFFSSDVGSTDTYAKFYADIEEFQIPMTQPDPALQMRRYHSRFIASKENKWQGSNFPRWVNKDYDEAVDAAENEIDPVKRAALYIKCNDLMWQDTVMIPVMHRIKVGATSNSLRAVMSGWANDLDNIQDWYREATG